MPDIYTTTYVNRWQFTWVLSFGFMTIRLQADLLFKACAVCQRKCMMRYSLLDISRLYWAFIYLTTLWVLLSIHLVVLGDNCQLRCLDYIFLLANENCVSKRKSISNFSLVSCFFLMHSVAGEKMMLIIVPWYENERWKYFDEWFNLFTP